MTILTSPPTPAEHMTLEHDAAYVATASRLAELQARGAALEQRRGELTSGLSRGEGRRDILTARAVRLLEDDVVPSSDGAEMIALRRDLGRVEDELAVVRRAVELQRPLVDRERARASREICQRLQPRHRQIVGAIAAALEQLSAALKAEQEFREELIEAGIEFTAWLRPMPFAAAGRLDDPNSHAAGWLKDARDAGLIA